MIILTIVQHQQISICLILIIYQFLVAKLHMHSVPRYKPQVMRHALWNKHLTDFQRRQLHQLKQKGQVGVDSTLNDTTNRSIYYKANKTSKPMQINLCVQCKKIVNKTKSDTHVHGGQKMPSLTQKEYNKSGVKHFDAPNY
jgi:hypothetical protein